MIRKKMSRRDRIGKMKKNEGKKIKKGLILKGTEREGKERKERRKEMEKRLKLDIFGSYT